MECFVCDSAAQVVNMLFSLVMYLLVLMGNLVIAMIDWLLRLFEIRKSKS